MTLAAAPAFGVDPRSSRGLNRAITWSFAVHFAAIALLLIVPRDWLTRQRPSEPLMTISLGGTPGPRSTGTTSIGGRTVEQAVPQPRRPEPIRPTPPAPPATVPVRPAPPARPAATPQPTTRPEPARPPTTGAQVTEGNTRVETGAQGQGAGLTFGGGGTGGETDLKNFCCPDYLEHLTGTITSHWRKDQPERGLTVLQFTIRRDGSITDVAVEQSSGSPILDRLARNALNDSRLLPLPAEYTRDTLVIHLRFPYPGSSR